VQGWFIGIKLQNSTKISKKWKLKNTTTITMPAIRHTKSYYNDLDLFFKDNTFKSNAYSVLLEESSRRLKNMFYNDNIPTKCNTCDGTNYIESISRK